MNRSPKSRFTYGLSSGLSILALFTVGYSLSGNIESAVAADDPTTANTKPPQVNIVEIPGAFKDLNVTKDAITSKQPDQELETALVIRGSATQAVIDASKGVTVTTTGKGKQGELQDFHATAYCLKGPTASGEHTRPGVIAADPRVLPLGTVVRIRAGRYTGTYTVLDTGSKIKGRLIDVYVPTYHEAKQFGRRRVKLEIVGNAKRQKAPARKK